MHIVLLLRVSGGNQYQYSHYKNTPSPSVSLHLYDKYYHFIAFFAGAGEKDLTVNVIILIY